jgi:hypothetical protein
MSEIRATRSGGPASVDPSTGVTRSTLQSLSAPAAFAPIRAVAMEVEARPSRMSGIEVLDYRPSHGDEHLFLAKPGTVTLFVARRNADVLSEIRKVVTTSSDSDRLLTARFMSQFERRTFVTLEAAATTLAAQSVFASVRYHGRTLAQSLFVPHDLDVCVVPMPYNGGHLSLDEFQLVEHHIPGNADRLEAIAVRHAPPLTRAEQAALKAVPADQDEWNVSSPMMCYALTGVTIVATVIAATSFCYHIETEEPIPEDEIRSIGPAATARKLLATRRRILEEGDGGTRTSND